MRMSHEEWMREMRRDNRRFAVLFTLAIAASFAAGIALQNYASNRPLFQLSPPAQIAPAQPEAPG